MRTFRRIAVYCGSSAGKHPEYAEAARNFGALLAGRGIGVVYGGGGVGLMKEVADGALAAGGAVIGVIPAKLLKLELAHPGVTLEVVSDMHARKMRMAELSDACVALPGGFGTFEELFEIITWTQLHYHDKPAGLLDVRGYWGLLDAFLDHAVAEGFVRPLHRGLVLRDDQPDRLLARLAGMDVPSLDKWLSQGAGATP